MIDLDILKDGDIIPGKGIGLFQIGWDRGQLLKVLDNYEVEKRAKCSVIKTPTIWFWLNEEELVFQIMVLNSFVGKFENLVGIGDTMTDVEKYFGNYIYEPYVWRIPNIEGICFELQDTDDEHWDEAGAPICTITVYAVS